MPESAELPAARRALARRRSVDMLRLAESVAGYAAAQLANGLGPEQARRAALDAAAELETIGAELRALALARLSPAGRRALAVELVGGGVSRRAAADLLGCAESTVRADLRRRAPARGYRLATNVPHPGRVSISPSSASGASALRTVRVATPNSCASVVVDGIRVPAG